MADNYIIEATIISIGEITQVSYTDKNTGQPKAFTKFEVECQVGDELHTFESVGFNRDKLTVGFRYMLEIQPKENFTDSIRKITPIEGATPQPKADTTPKPVTTPAPVPRKAPAPKDSPSPKADFASRWREYNTHARTAQMQATERVGWYVRLALEGKLVNEQGQKPDALTISTIQYWISKEIDAYWNEQEVRFPSDVFGDLKESE